jgi:para-aminobenzoate N-oxygenase AurF
MTMGFNAYRHRISHAGEGNTASDARPPERSRQLPWEKDMTIERFSYQAALAASQRINWRIEDIIGGDRRLDFTRPFLPEALAQTERLSFLTPAERRVLNQVRGHGYLYIFGLVEEFILPFVLDHTRARLDGDDHKIRALLQFANEEAKHIHLFKRFRTEFEAGFGSACAVIGPAEAVAKAVLSHHPLGVALAILQIEWMTQRHYLDSVKDDREIDPQFASLLKHHWMEECQHAKLDTLMVTSLVESYTAAEVEKGVEDYLAIGGFIDRGLEQQVAFDRESFERATGRCLTSNEGEIFGQLQHQANRWTFLGSGMTHPRFLSTLEVLGPLHRQRIESIAPAFC